MAKDTFFQKKTTLNAGGKLIDLSSPKVMGIINAVSYTHLDVYKRQTLTIAGCRPNHQTRYGIASGSSYSKMAIVFMT